MAYSRILYQYCVFASVLAMLCVASPTLKPGSVGTIENRQAIGDYPVPNSNNYDCRSTVHHNPVVFLHGLGSNTNSDLNVMQTNFSNAGYCTYGLTYGEETLFPGVGGLKPIATSSQQIAAFIKNVTSRTGAKKVDLVGHSEGALMSLYVPKFGGVSSIIDRIVAIAPPTHGTNLTLELYSMVQDGGPLTDGAVRAILAAGPCEACADIFGSNGPAIKKLNNGTPIEQSGNTITVIISRNDNIVTPPSTAQVNESGVKNIYVQDGCPKDLVGHSGLVYDTYVWGLVRRGLDPSKPLYPCTSGLPF